MTTELLALIGKRMTNPAAGNELVECAKALRVNSPMAAVRYERALQASGALSNPDTMPEEREELLAALNGISGEREESLRIRLSAREKATLQALAADAGESVSAYVRRTCGL